MTYRKLSDMVFFLTALFVWITVLLLAMFLPDIDEIFEWLGAIAANLIMFVFPGIGFLVADSRYGHKKDQGTWMHTFDRLLCWFFIIFAIAVFVIFLYTKIALGEEEPETTDIEIVE